MANKLPLFTLRPTVRPEDIESALTDYFTSHPGSADEPQLALHLVDDTPHPVYDDLAAGRFVAKLQNGMA